MTFHGGRISVFSDFSSPTSGRVSTSGAVVTRQRECYRSMAMADPLRMIAIALGRPTMAEALASLPAIRREADCLELRLDLFEEAFDLPLLLRERADLPTVVTLRPIDQGGKSRLTAAERLPVLLQAAELGADYVDLEWDAATPSAVAALKLAGTRVIVSRHDFSSMPPELGESWVDDLIHKNADVVKVV